MHFFTLNPRVKCSFPSSGFCLPFFFCRCGRGRKEVRQFPPPSHHLHFRRPSKTWSPFFFSFPPFRLVLQKKPNQKQVRTEDGLELGDFVTAAPPPAARRSGAGKGRRRKGKDRSNPEAGTRAQRRLAGQLAGRGLGKRAPQLTASRPAGLSGAPPRPLRGCVPWVKCWSHQT